MLSACCPCNTRVAMFATSSHTPTAIKSLDAGGNADVEGTSKLIAPMPLSAPQSLTRLLHASCTPLKQADSSQPLSAPQSLTRLLHASCTPLMCAPRYLTRPLHASYTPLARLSSTLIARMALCASIPYTPLTRLLHASRNTSHAFQTNNSQLPHLIG